MDQEPRPNTPLPDANRDFVAKPIEQPILDSSLRERIAPVSSEKANLSSGGLKGFYQTNKIYVWAILIGLIVIAVLAFFAFRPRPKPVAREANVKVEVQAAETAAAGSEVVYKIVVENQDDQKLVNLQLELVYPSGLNFISGSPKPLNLSGTLFSVPDLISGQNATIFLKARATGNVNDTKQLLARLHYKYSNFNSEFIKEGSNSIRLTASDVILELSGPTSANSAQLINYNVKYKNSSDQEIKNARVQLNYPEGFVFSSATPLPDLSNNVWNIISLASKAEGNVSIAGSFKSVGAGESKTTTAEFLVLGQNADYYTQSSASFTTGISSLPLLATQELASGQETDVVNPGQTLQFDIDYQNNGNTVASGVIILLTLNSKALDLATLRAEGGQVNNNTILWNASTVPKLESLAPSESGQLSFSVQVKNPATRDSSKNLTIVSDIKIKSNEYESYFPGNEWALKIASPATLSSHLDYQDGSLPPQVGKNTIYKVQFSLTNSTNDFSDGILTAFLPLGPSGFVTGSVNSSETGKVEFDSTTGKLTWKVGSLPAHTGKFSQARILEFKVKLNPAASQVDQSPNLVTDIKFQAKDIFTGKEVELKTEDITSADLAGQDGYVNGRVVP